MSVARCEEEVDSEEFVKWLVRYRKNPWGEWRADARAARICVTLARVHGNDKVELSDFMPVFDEEDLAAQESSGEEILFAFNMAAAASQSAPRGK